MRVLKLAAKLLVLNNSSNCFLNSIRKDDDNNNNNNNNRVNKWQKNVTMTHIISKNN
jgi:hypothetical protein